jgi:hypothetical protein
VERWFATFTEKQIRRCAHRSIRELEQAIRAYVQHNSGQPKLFVWTKAADEILASLARFSKIGGRHEVSQKQRNSSQEGVNKTTKPFSSSPVFNDLGRKNWLKSQFIHTFQSQFCSPS